MLNICNVEVLSTQTQDFVVVLSPARHVKA